MDDDDVDMLMKGNIDLDQPEANRRIKDKQYEWIRTLENDERLQIRFNKTFFTSGDSREPELAGIWSSAKGSFYTLVITLLLSFPMGVAAAIYLEEFAPKNRWTDLIEVNINNLAAVPSIVFGLLGLGFGEVGGLVEDETEEGGFEEPVRTSYRGIDVYKLTTWVQGPVMLQALNLLEPMNVKAMGYNSARYIHALYQAMNLSFADRDFYYGDPYVPPVEPIAGLLSKDYAKQRRETMNPERNDPEVRPGDPYPFQGGKNPFEALREACMAAAETIDSEYEYSRVMKALR